MDAKETEGPEKCNQENLQLLSLCTLIPLKKAFHLTAKYFIGLIVKSYFDSDTKSFKSLLNQYSRDSFSLYQNYFLLRVPTLR